jgi:hypothetical protein
MKNIFVIFFVFYLSAVATAQTANINLQKYWRFREKLKNFVVTGDCFGCSIPAEKRTGDDIIEWSDAAIHLGYYIGLLATEHKLLTLYNQSPDRIKETERELYYALEAINRLDLYAEYNWEQYALGIDHTGQTPPLSHLNGFFIRDDIHSASDFFNQQVDQSTVKQKLNSSWFPLPGDYELNIPRSGFTVGIDEGYGPREESLDQVAQLYTGLALVRKLIDPSLLYIESGTPKIFMDGEQSFVQEVKNISNRITSHIQSNGWKIENPVMPDCVQGVCANRSCAIGACGGGNVTGLCYGFYSANCYIQQWNSWCNSDGQTNGNSVVWTSTYQFSAALGSEDFKILTLATIGHVWGSATKHIVRDRCTLIKANHLPLLYAVLHDDATVMPPQKIYTDMLSDAWCKGSNGYEGPVKWRGQSWLLYGPNTDTSRAPVHFNNIDYMLYFNLHALIYPQYLNNNYRYYSPQELCDESVEENNITQQQNRILAASGNMQLENYRVADDGSHPQLQLYAGKSISIKSGTSFMPGVNVTATISKTLGAYDCFEEVQSFSYSARIDRKMEIIPNPSNGNFKVVVTDPSPEAVLIVYDASGHIIEKRNMVNASNEFTVPVSGLYLVKMEMPGQSLTGKALVIPGY